jgi:hypothetical protein
MISLEGAIMNKIILLPLIVIVCLVIASAPGYANLMSTFDNSTEGWTGDDPTNHDWGSVTWISSGGNPGGFIKGSETNPIGGTGYFIAPASWTGNLSSYIGGTLEYDILIISGTSYFGDDDVRIYSGSNYLSCQLSNSYWSGWKTFSVRLVPANFVAQGSNFKDIMSNVTAIWIRGEYIEGAESEGLDNVKLTTPFRLSGVLLLLLGEP